MKAFLEEYGVVVVAAIVIMIIVVLNSRWVTKSETASLKQSQN